MSHLKTLTLSQLAQQADKWDDLWQRSETRLPSRRFAGLQLWCRVFAPDQEFTAIVVEDDGRFLAGIPLIKDKRPWPFSIYRLPSNSTVGSGDLLVDPDGEFDAALGAIAHRICRLPGLAVALEGIPIQSERWKRLIAALEREGRAMHLSPGHDVGVVDIQHDWNAYMRSLSANHRSSLKRARQRLEAEGEVTVERLRNPSDTELFETLEVCFAIENKGWKGENGTSILGTPGLRDYYHQEARIMRDLGYLDVWLLKLNGQVIAFEYCQFAKGTCFSHKISFDPQFNRFSPGKVLQYIQLERYHEDPAAEQLDTLGVLCEAKAKWTTRSYKSSRCFVAIGGRGSNMLLRSYQSLRSVAKSLRRNRPKQDAIQTETNDAMTVTSKSPSTAAIDAPITATVTTP
ncbi:MAG: GNAT family N-acetyltransferase [Planctomycetota bacterium]|nr:GNAT family N-acetyltransferase [Planctomycetota bacterium]MDA1179990.1 GNAT family N-acetyltransferase [Planctomycetota bacterium]